jgi:hypothetical protein
MPVLVDNPLEVGADRIVNAVAAFHQFGGPCIVVDFGTAITFDGEASSSATLVVFYEVPTANDDSYGAAAGTPRKVLDADLKPRGFMRLVGKPR